MMEYYKESQATYTLLPGSSINCCHIKINLYFSSLLLDFLVAATVVF